MALVVAAIVIAIAVVAIPKNDGPTATTVASAPNPENPVSKPVTRAPKDSAGSNPFSASVAKTPTGSTVPDATVPPAAIASSVLTTQDGSTPGLYGGTRNVSSCDSKQLVDFLAANPDKGQAFADTESITPAQIPAYIASLTPVILRADTRVTNNGFANGRATPFQAVLEAGTAVLVDNFGVPRVRCFCGNPLLAPQYIQPVYEGPTWQGFTPAAVVIVAPAPAPITNITIVDVNTGKPFDRPVGTDGTKDKDTPASTATNTTTPRVSGGSTPGGNYTLTLQAAKFSGTEGQLKVSSCARLVTPPKEINVVITINGRSITVTDNGSFSLAGIYDPGGRSFSAARPVESINGSGVQVLRGIFDASGDLTGEYVYTLAPPSASCTSPATGARTSGAPSSTTTTTK